MTRYTPFLAILCLLAGCPDFDGVETDSNKLVCDDMGCSICEGLDCQSYTCNTVSQCPSGYTCNAASACVPLSQSGTGPTATNSAQPSAQCGHTSHCPEGQVCENLQCIDPAQGTPAVSDECTLSSQCDDGLICIDGACAEKTVKPQEEPSGCSSDVECENGHICSSGECVAKSFPLRPEGTCEFNLDCGPSGTCVNSHCYFAPTKSGCPVGAHDVAGLCMPLDSGDECSLNTDCGQGQLCINAICTLMCTKDAACTHGTYCGEDGLCALDDRPILQCLLNTDCDKGLSCVDGRCLNSCSGASEKEAASMCGDTAEQCQFGFCMPTASCFVAKDCLSSAQCIDGQCGYLSPKDAPKDAPPADDTPTDDGPTGDAPADNGDDESGGND